MTTIKDKLQFNYNGVWSNTFGLLHATTESGLFEESLTASRSIIETPMRGRDKPHFTGFDYSPLEFEMTIVFEHGFDNKKLDDVIKWLIQDYYKPLYFEGKENKQYYCMVVDEPQIVHNGAGGGYINLTMRCNSPFVYSPVLVSQLLNYSTSGAGNFELYNEGYGFLYPEISIEMVGAGNILIRNVNNGGEDFRITGLSNGEEIYINCEKEIIETDLASLGVYRYNNISGEFPRLTHGLNTLRIEGKCKIQFRYQFKYRF